jgi:hypothetical protein
MKLIAKIFGRFTDFLYLCRRSSLTEDFQMIHVTNQPNISHHPSDIDPQRGSYGARAAVFP